MNDSTTGGYLLPITQPITGQALSRFVQQLISGVTGLAGTLVRPAWQAEPGNIPSFSVAWCGFQISSRETQGFAWENFDATSTVYSLYRQEEMMVLCSFYDSGVDQTADQFAVTLRDGLQLGQNREVLTGAGFGFIRAGAIVPLPTLLKERWLYRVDLPLYFRRTLQWTYPVTTIIAAQALVESQTLSGSLITQTINLP